MKTIAKAKRWTEEKEIPGRAIYSNFLVGNGLSILYPVVAIGGINWAIGAPLDRDYVLAIGVPLTLVLINIAFILRLHRKRSEIKCELSNREGKKTRTNRRIEKTV